jgi:PEP-CTERM motif
MPNIPTPKAFAMKPAPSVRSLFTLLPAVAAACLLGASPAQAGSTNGFGVAVSATAQFAYDGNQTVSAYRKLPDSSGNWSTTIDSPGVQRLGCPSPVSDSGFLCYSSATGTGSSSGTNYDLTSAVANASRSDNAGYNASDFATGLASARANLATGEIGVSASSDKFRSVLAGPTWNGGLAYAQQNDTLTFKVASATAATLTQITVGFELDGSLSVFPGQPGMATIDDQFYFGSASARYTASIGTGSPSPNFAQGGWLSHTWEETGTNSLRFTGIYALTGASEVVGISNSLGTFAGQGGISDFLTTSKISLGLPTGVTFTSNSGVFLSGAAVSPPVPEPGTYALMLAGLAGVGFVARRRRGG